jgi:hypothetical protein
MSEEFEAVWLMFGGNQKMFLREVVLERKNLLNFLWCMWPWVNQHLYGYHGKKNHQFFCLGFASKHYRYSILEINQGV